MISNLEKKPYAEVIAMLERLAKEHDLLLSSNLIDFADDLWAIATEGNSMKLQKLIQMIERAYELGVQAQAGDPDQALSEEVTSECAEFLAVWEEDWGSFESMDIVDKDILELVTTLKGK